MTSELYSFSVNVFHIPNIDSCFFVFSFLSATFQFPPSMDRGPTEGVGTVEVSSKDFPSIQAVHSQDAMVADLLQQAAEAGGVVEGQAGVVLEQGSYLI